MISKLNSIPITTKATHMTALFDEPYFAGAIFTKRVRSSPNHLHIRIFALPRIRTSKNYTLVNLYG